MFVGYADGHIGDVYRFINLKTQHVILSRDARWMKIMWKAYMTKQQCINHGLQIIYEDLNLMMMKYKKIGSTINLNTETEKKVHHWINKEDWV